MTVTVSADYKRLLLDTFYRWQRARNPGFAVHALPAQSETPDGRLHFHGLPEEFLPELRASGLPFEISN